MYLSLQRLCQVHNPDRQAMQQPCNRSPQPMTQQARGSQMYVVARASHPMKENSATCTSRPGCGPEGMQPLTHPSHPPHCRCCHQPRTHWQQQNRHGAQVQPFDTGSHKQPLGGPRLCLLSKLLLQTHQHMPFRPQTVTQGRPPGPLPDTTLCAPHASAAAAATVQQILSPTADMGSTPHMRCCARGAILPAPALHP
jgi:hypothetical protein